MSIVKLSDKLRSLGRSFKDFKNIDFFNKINEIIQWINDNESYVTPAYTEYVALLTQSGTNAPEEDDIEGNGGNTPMVDTITGVWSYSNVGRYRYTKTGAFTDSTKIWYNLGYNVQNNAGADISISLSKINDDTLELRVARLSTFASGVPPTLTDVNGVLYNQPIQIRVYN